MSSNNNQRSQGNDNQGSKSPSQESFKPKPGSPETAGNQQDRPEGDRDMVNDTSAQDKQGNADQTEKTGQARTPGDQKSEKSENTGNANAAKSTGTR